MSTATRPIPNSAVLSQIFPLLPIHTEAELTKALKIADELFRRELDEDEEQYLDSLCKLIDRYAEKQQKEEEQYLDSLCKLIDRYAEKRQKEEEQKPDPTPKLNPAKELRKLLGKHHLTRNALSREVGIHPSLMSRYTTGNRTIPRKHAELLAKRFQVKPEVFLET